MRQALSRQSARSDELAAELERHRESTNDMQRRFEDAILTLRQSLPINNGNNNNNGNPPSSRNSGNISGNGHGATAMVSLSGVPISPSITSSPSFGGANPSGITLC